MNWHQLLRRRILDALRATGRRAEPGAQDRRLRRAPASNVQTAGELQEPLRHRRPDRPPPASQSTAYPGDFTGQIIPVYDPHPDGVPDPGEIVWTWVPYEEDHSRGKDRPVLLIGRDGPWLLGLQVTSRDHDADVARQRRAGRHWVDIDAGDWDVRRRPSEVRVNRFIRVDPSAVRRIGAILDEDVFERVAEGVARYA